MTRAADEARARRLDPSRLPGAWELQRWYVTLADGTEMEPLGPGATGLLLFTADGWATITASAADRPRLSRRNPGAASLEERAAAFDTFVNYCCRWRVVADTVELRVLLAQNPAMVGTVQVRRLQMRGRTLTTLSVETVPNGQRVHRLVWRPARAPAGERERRRSDNKTRKRT
ncbi:MAG TPA: lipocalin-like domain-containing protein [Steroidobacteraceae bacterium]